MSDTYRRHIVWWQRRWVLPQDLPLLPTQGQRLPCAVLPGAPHARMFHAPRSTYSCMSQPIKLRFTHAAGCVWLVNMGVSRVGLATLPATPRLIACGRPLAVFVNIHCICARTPFN